MPGLRNVGGIVSVAAVSLLALTSPAPVGATATTPLQWLRLLSRCGSRKRASGRLGRRQVKRTGRSSLLTRAPTRRPSRFTGITPTALRSRSPSRRGCRRLTVPGASPSPGVLPSAGASPPAVTVGPDQSVPIAVSFEWNKTDKAAGYLVVTDTSGANQAVTVPFQVAENVPASVFVTVLLVAAVIAVLLTLSVLLTVWKWHPQLDPHPERRPDPVVPRQLGLEPDGPGGDPRHGPRGVGLSRRRHAGPVDGYVRRLQPRLCLPARGRSARVHLVLSEGRRRHHGRTLSRGRDRPLGSNRGAPDGGRTAQARRRADLGRVGRLRGQHRRVGLLHAGVGRTGDQRLEVGKAGPGRRRDRGTGRGRRSCSRGGKRTGRTWNCAFARPQARSMRSRPSRRRPPPDSRQGPLPAASRPAGRVPLQCCDATPGMLVEARPRPPASTPGTQVVHAACPDVGRAPHGPG